MSKTTEETFDLSTIVPSQVPYDVKLNWDKTGFGEGVTVKLVKLGKDEIVFSFQKEGNEAVELPYPEVINAMIGNMEPEEPNKENKKTQEDYEQELKEFEKNKEFLKKRKDSIFRLTGYDPANKNQPIDFSLRTAKKYIGDNKQKAKSSATAASFLSQPAKNVTPTLSDDKQKYLKRKHDDMSDDDNNKQEEEQSPEKPSKKQKKVSFEFEKFDKPQVLNFDDQEEDSDEENDNMPVDNESSSEEENNADDNDNDDDESNTSSNNTPTKKFVISSKKKAPSAKKSTSKSSTSVSSDLDLDELRGKKNVLSSYPSEYFSKRFSEGFKILVDEGVIDKSNRVFATNVLLGVTFPKKS